MYRDQEYYLKQERQKRMSQYSWSIPLGAIILSLSFCYMLADYSIGLPVFLTFIFLCFFSFVCSIFGLWHYRKNKFALRNSALGILASLTLPFLFVIITLYLPLWSSEYEGQEAKEKISQILLSDLPQNATHFHWLENPMIEWHAHARFEAPKEEVLQWLSDDDFCADNLFYSFPIITPPMNRPDWWQMKSTGNQIKVYCPERYTKNHISYYISVDTMRVGPSQVYLYGLDS